MANFKGMADNIEVLAKLDKVAKLNVNDENLNISERLKISKKIDEILSIDVADISNIYILDKQIRSLFDRWGKSELDEYLHNNLGLFDSVRDQYNWVKVFRDTLKKKQILSITPKYYRTIHSNIRYIQMLAYGETPEFEFSQLNKTEEDIEIRSKALENRLDFNALGFKYADELRYDEILSSLKIIGVDLAGLGVSDYYKFSERNLEKVTRIYNYYSHAYGWMNKRYVAVTLKLINNCNYILNNIDLGVNLKLSESQLKFIYMGNKYTEQDKKCSLDIYKLLMTCNENYSILGIGGSVPLDYIMALNPNSELINEMIPTLNLINRLIKIVNKTFNVEVKTIREIYDIIEDQFGITTGDLSRVFSMFTEPIRSIYKTYIQLREDPNYKGKLPRLPKSAEVYEFIPAFIGLICKIASDKELYSIFIEKCKHKKFGRLQIDNNNSGHELSELDKMLTVLLRITETYEAVDKKFGLPEEDKINLIVRLCKQIENTTYAVDEDYSVYKSLSKVNKLYARTINNFTLVASVLMPGESVDKIRLGMLVKVVKKYYVPYSLHKISKDIVEMNIRNVEKPSIKEGMALDITALKHITQGKQQVYLGNTIEGTRQIVYGRSIALRKVRDNRTKLTKSMIDKEYYTNLRLLYNSELIFDTELGEMRKLGKKYNTYLGGI